MINAIKWKCFMTRIKIITDTFFYYIGFKDIFYCSAIKQNDIKKGTKTVLAGVSFSIKRNLKNKFLSHIFLLLDIKMLTTLPVKVKM